MMLLFSAPSACSARDGFGFCVSPSGIDFMPTKIKIATSACLLGNNVRYDGGHKLDQHLIQTLGPLVEWVPICPEAESGMSIPREPMQLVSDKEKVRMITIETKQDMTDMLLRWTAEKLKHMKQEGIRGFIFKARSPSCGVHDTELFSLSGQSIGIRVGLFAEAAGKYFPSLPVEDEECLRDPGIRKRFLARILP